MNKWRAGCGESRTSGSEGGPQKPTSRNADRALRPDPYTEHRTREGKLHVAAIKDVFSNRIVGWAIDERMKARLVVAAIEMALARRHGIVLLAAAKERARPPPLVDPRRAPHRDRDLDRTHLPSPSTPSPPWPLDPDRIRDNHDPSDGTRRLNNPCPRRAADPRPQFRPCWLFRLS